MSLIAGFPQPNGSKIESLITKTGPASYTVISVATPPTGGQDVEAREFGMKFIEFLEASGSDDGQYAVRCIPVRSSAKVTTWKLQWVVAATGVEVTAETALSGRTVRLRALGI